MTRAGLPRYTTPDAVAFKLQVKRRTVIHWLRTGVLPGGIRIGGCWRIHEDTINAHLSSGTSFKTADRASDTSQRALEGSCAERLPASEIQMLGDRLAEGMNSSPASPETPERVDEHAHSKNRGRSGRQRKQATPVPVRSRDHHRHQATDGSKPSTKSKSASSLGARATRALKSIRACRDEVGAAVSEHTGSGGSVEQCVSSSRRDPPGWSDFYRQKSAAQTRDFEGVAGGRSRSTNQFRGPRQRRRRTGAMRSRWSSEPMASMTAVSGLNKVDVELPIDLIHEQRSSTPTSRESRDQPDARRISVRGYLLCRTTEEEEQAGPAADPRLLVTPQRAPQVTSALPDGVQAAVSGDRRRQQECASIALNPDPPANPTSPRAPRPYYDEFKGLQATRNSSGIQRPSFPSGLRSQTKCKAATPSITTEASYYNSLPLIRVCYCTLFVAIPDPPVSTPNISILNG